MSALTDSSIKRLEPKSSAYRVSCPSVTGFYVKVYPSGRKTFELRVARDGASKYYRLGEWGKTPLSVARQKGRDALARIDQGLPATADAEPRASFDELLAAWLHRQQQRGRRRLPEIRRLIEVNLPVALRAKPAQTITSLDLRDMLAVVHRRGSRVLANRLRTHLHGVFQYGLEVDHDPARVETPRQFGITVNPVAAIPRDQDAAHVGERVLSWEEISAVWTADDAVLSWTARQAARLLLLTGCRVNEVCQAAWAEVDAGAGLWIIPARRYKSKRDHSVPLTPLIRQLLCELHAVYPGTWWLPARNLTAATQPWSGTALGHALRDYGRRIGGEPFSGRDLRRTWKTRAGEIGLSLEIRNRVQGHALQDVGSRHYDRYAYLPEKRHALETWEQALLARLPGADSRGDPAG